MYQMYAAKRLNSNEDIFAVLEYWLKSYNSQLNTDDVLALIEDKTNLLENPDFRERLKSWAIQNKKIVIVSSCSVVVLAVASLTLNSPIASITDISTGETTIAFNRGEEDNREESLTPGFYYVDEKSRIVNEEGIESNLYIDTQFDKQNGNRFIFLNPGFMESLFLRDSINDMLKEQMQEQLEEMEAQERMRAEEERLQAEELRVKEEKQYIEFYCAVYGLDFEKVYQILSDITNNFMDEEYLQYYKIGPSKMKNREVQCDSKEMAILIAVRNIYYTPDAYNYPNNDLRTGIEFETEIDYSHQIAYICNVLNLDPALHWAICNAECSFKSPLFLNSHNPAGLRFSSDGFTAFPSFTAGFIEEALELLKYKIDGKTTIESIGAIHAPLSDSTNSVWVPNVKGGYGYAISNYNSLFVEGETFQVLDDVSLEFPEQEMEDIDEKECIKLYCRIYGLDFETVYQMISESTNGFTNELYLENNIIPFAKIGDTVVNCHNKEKAILLSIHHIYHHSEQYGYSLNSLKTNSMFTSKLTYAEQIAYLSDVLEIDTCLNYAICKASGGFNSSMFTTMHNPSGMKENGEYIVFPNVTVGFIEQSIKLLEMRVNSPSTLQSVGLGYYGGEYDASWEKDISSIYRYVSQNYEEIFGTRNKTISNKVYVLF